MKRILLTGVDGQVGRELKNVLAPLGEVIGVDRKTLDLSQPDQILQVLAVTQPELIVNAAAYTAVDKAETEVGLALAINATAPTIMAEEASRLGIALIHLSTDYVFDGKKNTPYTEQDQPNPLSAYGQSKLAGELGIQTAGDRHIILRTAWVYGRFGKSNFVKTMLRLGAERQDVRVVADQIGSPTWAQDIAQAIGHFTAPLIDVQISAEPSQLHKPLSGIYHLTNSGVASWYDFAVAIFEEARLLGFPLKVERIIPITTIDYPTPAQRPAYSVLASHKITDVLGTYPPHWRHSLRQMLKALSVQVT
jgi:dTDP-4-dehydrorhamnose reductase